MKEHSTFFAPQLYLINVARGMEFYKKAFDATVLQQWNNEDGSVHVAEMSIGGALFHLHEEVKRVNEMSPESLKATSVVLGLFVNDVHAVFAKAIAAGGKELEPVKDHDYNYRQGLIADPFGHLWLIEKKIG